MTIIFHSFKSKTVHILLGFGCPLLYVTIWEANATRFSLVVCLFNQNCWLTRQCRIQVRWQMLAMFCEFYSGKSRRSRLRLAGWTVSMLVVFSLDLLSVVEWLCAWKFTMKWTLFGSCFVPPFHSKWGLSGFGFRQNWQVFLSVSIRNFCLIASLTCAPRCQSLWRWSRYEWPPVHPVPVTLHSTSHGLNPWWAVFGPSCDPWPFRDLTHQAPLYWCQLAQETESQKRKAQTEDTRYVTGVCGLGRARTCHGFVAPDAVVGLPTFAAAVTVTSPCSTIASPNPVVMSPVSVADASCSRSDGLRHVSVANGAGHVDGAYACPVADGLRHVTFASVTPCVTGVVLQYHQGSFIYT